MKGLKFIDLREPLMEYLKTINDILECPNKYILTDYFEKEGYIRLNMIYFSPLNLVSIRQKFEEIGLMSWLVTPKGMRLGFDTGQILFDGNLNIFGRDKIFSIELDFDPQILGNGMELLNEIEG